MVQSIYTSEWLSRYTFTSVSSWHMQDLDDLDDLLIDDLDCDI